MSAPVTHPTARCTRSSVTPHHRISLTLQTVTKIHYVLHSTHQIHVTFTRCSPAPVTHRTADYTYSSATYHTSNGANRCILSVTCNFALHIYHASVTPHTLELVHYVSHRPLHLRHYKLKSVRLHPLYLNHPVHASVTSHSLQLGRYITNIPNRYISPVTTHQLHLKRSTVRTSPPVTPRERYKPLHVTSYISTTRHPVASSTSLYLVHPEHPLHIKITRYATTHPLQYTTGTPNDPLHIATPLEHLQRNFLTNT